MTASTLSSIVHLVGLLLFALALVTAAAALMPGAW